MSVAAVRVDPNLPWYIARASGMVAWALVTASVGWGLVVSGRLTRKIPPPAWNLDLHRFLGGLAIVFTGVHLAGLAMDKYVTFGVHEFLVPMASTWRPGPVTWGVTGVYLLIAIEATSLLMRHLPRRLWRTVHGSAFALFIVATVHALQTGTDAKRNWLLLPALGMASVTMVTGALRVAGLRRRRRRAVARPGPRRAAPVRDGDRVEESIAG